MIEFYVPGHPATKGSTDSFRNPQTGKIVTQSNNKRLAGWEARVGIAARQAAGLQPFPAQDEPALLRGAVGLTLNFWVERPKSHYINNDGKRLRSHAPRYHSQRLDLDKMIRAIGDAITSARIVHDDGQIAYIDARKLWAAPGQAAGVSVIVEALKGDNQ